MGSTLQLGQECEVIVSNRLQITSGKILLCAVTLEAALFGSGRMLEIGPFTVKMLLFSLTLIYTAWSLLSFDRIRYSTALFTASFLTLLCFGVINGLCYAANMKFLGEDVSPLLSFLTLLFFEFTIRSKLEINLVIRIIVFAAIVMAVGYAVIIILLLLRIVPFVALYGWINEVGSNEFVFEGVSGRVFYKGALFIPIAIIFLVFRKGRWSRAIASLLFLSLFVVGSRGLFLALALTAILYILIGPMRAVKKLDYGFIVILIASISLTLIFSLFGDKTGSNAPRIDTMSQVLNRINPVSIIVGHGFGIGVPAKPEHMEIMYAEIFHKQGLIGLLWWASLIAIMAIRLRKAIKNGNRDLAYPLFLSAIFIVLESVTNPFLNNPIGMYPFIIFFVGLGVLARPDMQRSAIIPPLSANSV